MKKGNKINKGRRWSEETIRKIKESNKRNPKHKELGRRVGLSNIGRKLSEEHKASISKGLKGKQAGEKSWNWKGGITPLRKKLYFSLEYKLWRTAVFERDNYTCIWCGVKGGELNADHIKPWAEYPELRFAIDNGRTLCVPCHRTTDTWGVHKVNSLINHFENEKCHSLVEGDSLCICKPYENREA